MNLDDYKNAMKEIPVNTAEIEVKLKDRVKARRKVNNKIRVIKIVPVFALAIILFAIIASWFSMPENASTITMKVYAAEQEKINLSEEFVAIDTQMDTILGGYTIDGQGNYTNADITYNIHFICEGESIDTITYSCSDKEITRDGRANELAYYVENITLPVEEYKKLILSQDDNFVSGFYGEGEENATIISMIGSSYTVDYEEQENIQYGLVVAATVGEDKIFKCEDLAIRVEIKMEDDTTIYKQLLLDFGEDALHEVQIKIMN